MNSLYQVCPLCNAPVDFTSVYPHYVCHACITEAKDHQGEPLTFFHSVFVPGGLQVYHRENKELIPFPARFCHIKGLTCSVKYDADFGIVVQPYLPVAEAREEAGIPEKKAIRLVASMQ